MAYAPGTTPYFATPPKPVVKVTEAVFQPWTFSITKEGIAGREVPRGTATPNSAPSATSVARPSPAAPRSR
jgi:hypothetical protein